VSSSPSAIDEPLSLIREIKSRLGNGHAELRARYEKNDDAPALLRGLARLVDQVLLSLWDQLGIPDGFTLAAVGGYGRGELYPASDIDLLLLVPEGFDPALEPRLERLISLFWDIGLDVGHSVRTPLQCIEEATRDITVHTALLEARYLTGSRTLFAELGTRIASVSSPLDFFKAKQLEQAERYARYNDTPYSLEPNCKESPGGLRDLQVIMWVARAGGFGCSWRDMVAPGLVTREEARQLRQAETYLSHLRIRLHHIVKRKEDRILFDHQERLAQAMGCAATESRRASEVLMQRYYRNAKLVTQLNTLVMQNLSARLLPSAGDAPRPLDGQFQAIRDLLDIRDDDAFERDPSLILRSFLVLEQHSELKGMTARTLRNLWRARTRIDAGFRRDQGNRALFLALFQQKHLIHELRRLNQYDILGRYLPAFGRIVGQMQHDLFHVYTVDQHIMQVIRNVRRFTMIEFSHEYPFCTRLIASFERHWLLYVAALFHDIAKGRGGDHSKLGMSDARRFCRDHGIGAEDTDLIVFLVEHHLTMSSVAQKQDLSDPDVIRRFAAIAGTERRLTALYLLTVADIRGTSPKVWNAWKGKLLEDLFRMTLTLLRGDAPLQMLGVSERQDEARRLLRYYGLAQGIEDPLWQQLDTAYFMRHDAGEIAWHTRTLYYRPDPGHAVVRARLNPIGEGLQVMVYCPDQPQLFAHLCGFFSRIGYTILDAKIHTTRHHYGLDSFVLMDADEAMPYRDMIALIEHDLVEHLKSGEALPRPMRGRVSRQVRHFPIEPRVEIRADEKGSQHVMSIIAADRPGLLFDIARILSEHAIDVQTAKVNTLGERAEDTFLISGNELGKSSTLVRLEQELLAALQV
jgi:[protein-PII] uridylyltransferase